MSELAPYIQSLAVIAALALSWGGIALIRRGPERGKGVLMIVAALVLIGNLLVWVVPMGAPTAN